MKRARGKFTAHFQEQMRILIRFHYLKDRN